MCLLFALAACLSASGLASPLLHSSLLSISLLYFFMPLGRKEENGVAWRHLGEGRQGKKRMGGGAPHSLPAAHCLTLFSCCLHSPASHTACLLLYPFSSPSCGGAGRRAFIPPSGQEGRKNISGGGRRKENRNISGKGICLALLLPPSPSASLSLYSL